MSERKYKTRSGAVLDDADIERLADEAEAGYDTDEIIARRGRRPMGSGPAAVVPVRLDPDLHSAALARASDDDSTLSDVIRSALRKFLDVP